jgi:hypothetical protein
MTAQFRPGGNPLNHYWELRSPAGDLLALTARIHHGGRAAQAFRKFLSYTAMEGQ